MARLGERSIPDAFDLWPVSAHRLTVEKKLDLLDLAAGAPPIADRIRRIAQGEGPVAFSHVLDSAQPFLLATIARAVQKPIWVVCPSVRIQESFYESLVNWLPAADFLPEAEF